MSRRQKFNENNAKSIPIKRIRLDSKFFEKARGKDFPLFDHYVHVPEEPYPILTQSSKNAEETVLHISVDNPSKPKQLIFSFMDGTNFLKRTTLDLNTLYKTSQNYSKSIAEQAKEVTTNGSLDDVKQTFNISDLVLADYLAKKTIYSEEDEVYEKICKEAATILNNTLSPVADFQPELIGQLAKFFMDCGSNYILLPSSCIKVIGRKEYERGKNAYTPV